ncbi:hypothetical protein GPECTOR_16g752 [Gonium pectorale]|uniref:RRM domain-containing protein n=1 Tax=Gonium pectorale TaxID=33097 RepID=A0A150GLB6_GONPE|nr:hypothetical protein GPECTOR_16g752 [Gonium pectorale]|eukprot:KXZ50577.1 hypothetical protein GPECTOR_16g752 [Gonium pectorale]
MDPLSAPQSDLNASQAVAAGPAGFAGAGELSRVQPRTTAQDQSSAILKLKGLPYSATEDDIRQFFAPYELKGVSFVYEPDGRPSGLAFAEFVSKEEALKALSKNGEYIGQRYVRLLHVPRAEMEEQVRLGTLAIPGAAAKLRSRMIRSQQRNNAVYMAAGPMQLMPSVLPGGRPVMPTLGPHGGPGPAAGMGGPYVQAAGPGQVAVESRLWQPAYQQAYPQQQQQGAQSAAGQGLQALPGQQLASQQLAGPGLQAAGGGIQYQSPAQLAAQFSGLSLTGHQQVGAGGMPQGAPGLPPQRGAQMLPQGLAAAQALHMAAAPPPATGGGHFVAGTRVVQAATSPTIKIRGLPYGSSPQEILAFFQTYHFLPDTLQIGLDQLGRPSGEAWLSFSSPQEALRAVRDLNRHYLGNRYLELSIC